MSNSRALLMRFSAASVTPVSACDGAAPSSVSGRVQCSARRGSHLPSKPLPRALRRPGLDGSAQDAGSGQPHPGPGQCGVGLRPMGWEPTATPSRTGGPLARSSLEKVRSALEKVQGPIDEVLVVLEDAAVAGVGVDRQLGIREASGHVDGVDSRHHPIVVAVHHQDRVVDA